MTQKTCEKLKSEIELNKIKKDVAIKFRKNIELKIDILKLNISYLIEEVSRLKTLNEELSYKSECFTSVCDKLPENLQSTYSEQAQVCTLIPFFSNVLHFCVKSYFCLCSQITMLKKRLKM